MTYEEFRTALDHYEALGIPYEITNETGYEPSRIVIAENTRNWQRFVFNESSGRVINDYSDTALDLSDATDVLIGMVARP